MDKATPTPSPATVDSVIALVRQYGAANWLNDTEALLNAVTAEVERLAAQAAPPDTQGSAFGQITREHAHSLWETVNSIEWRDGLPVHVHYAYALLRRFGKPVSEQSIPVQALVTHGLKSIDFP